MGKRKDFIQKQAAKGRTILTSIIALNLLMFLIMMVLSLGFGAYSSLIGLILMIVLCGFIYYGRQAAKWIYIVLAAIDLLRAFASLTSGGINLTAALTTLVLTGIPVLTSVILVCSTSVKEFMYSQQNKG